MSMWRRSRRAALLRSSALSSFTCLHTTATRRALERVEVAHMKSYQQPRSARSPSVTPSSSNTLSTPLTSPSRYGRKGISSPSPLFASLHGKGTSAAAATAADSHFSMDYVLSANDMGGPPATQNNGSLVARSLGESIAAAEHFYFRQGDHRGGVGQDPFVDGGYEDAANDDEDGGAEDDGGSGGGAAHATSSSFFSSTSPGHRDRRRRGQQQQQYHFCALCREEIDPAVMSPRQHILHDSRASHTNHNCREVVLDSLALLGTRGYPVDHMYHVWSTTLFHHPLFPRIHSWVRPWWPIETRAARLFKLLHGLKNVGIIDVSLAGVAPDTPGAEAYHHRRRLAFERLEYIGDNAWGTRVSSRMMLLFPDQQWQYSERAYAFNCFRDAVEMNVTNEILFDALHLERLFPPAQQLKLGSGKLKADVVEALVGELHVALWGYEPRIYDDVGYVEVNGGQEDRLVGVLEHCLTELYDLILLNYCRELSWNAVPLAKELAARHMWQGMRPSLTTQKSFFRRHASNTGSGVAALVHVHAFTPPVPTVGTASALTDEHAGPMATVGGSEEDTGTHPIDGRGRDAPPATSSASAAAADGLARARVLPGVPQLFATPTPYPRTVPNPLRTLPLADMPADTKSAFTGLDVFADFVKSYERLGLLSDDAFQVFDVQDADTCPPRWEELVGALVPSLAAVGGYARAGGHPLLDSESAYFMDPYFNLFDSPLGHGSPAAEEAAPSPRMWGSLVLPHITRASPMTGLDERLSFLRGITYPKMQETPTAPDGSDGRGASADTQRREAADGFMPSRFVPTWVTAPSAGVVTDRNLYPGQFAFLAFELGGAAGNDGAFVEFGSARATARAPVRPRVEGEDAAPDVAEDLGRTSGQEGEAVGCARSLKDVVMFWVEQAEGRRNSPEAAALFQNSRVVRPAGAFPPRR